MEKLNQSKNKIQKRLFFTGGGTAGHVYPALSIIEEIFLQQERHSFQIYWLGRKNSFEEELIKQSPISDSIQFLPIFSGKLRRYFSIKNFSDIFKIFLGFVQSLFYIMKYKPILVFSKGGFVSVPPILAAWLCRVPALTHESDITPGLATKINSSFCQTTLLSWDESKKYFSQQSKILVVGNPIRSQLRYREKACQENWLKAHNISLKVPILFVMGGSLGARQINNLLNEMRENLKTKVFIIHQTGKEIKPYKDDSYWCLPFFNTEDLSFILSISYLVISRSGASSLSELATFGKCMILIPLQEGSRGDQLINSLYFEKRKAAIVFKETPISSLEVLTKINHLLIDSALVNSYEKHSQALASQQSARKCAEHIINCFFLKASLQRKSLHLN